MPPARPPLLTHILELKKELKELRGDITYIKEFIQAYEENKKKKDMVLITGDDETTETTETLVSSPPQAQGWFW